MLINTDYTCTNPANTGNRGRRGVKSDYRYLVIHYTGALDTKNPGNEQTAKNNCIYYRDCKVGASANYYVDRNSVYMSVPWDASRYAWHCGIGAGNTVDKYLINDGVAVCNNATSLGIEICTCKVNPASKSSSDADWYIDPQTWINAVELVKYLMDFFDIDINHIYRHFDVNTIHKRCPAMMVSNQVMSYYGKTGEAVWADFLNDLRGGSGEKSVCQAYKVNSDDGTLNLRLKGANSGALITTMKTGDFVLALAETTEGWMRVKYVADDKVYEGYCYGRYLEKAVPIQTKTVDSPDGRLSVRADANTKGALIVEMENGYKFNVLSKVNAYWGIIQCGETLGYSNITNKYSK